MMRQSPSGLFEVLQEEEYSEQLARVRESIDIARKTPQQAGCDSGGQATSVRQAPA